MPKRKTVLTEEERRKRLREAAREHGTSDDPKGFEQAFKRVASPHPTSSSSAKGLLRQARGGKGPN